MTWQGPTRVLVADDEPLVLETYQRILAPPAPAGPSELEAYGARLFGSTRQGELNASYDVTLSSQTSAAVEEVRRACEQGRPFAVAFLDVRMPPGMNGVWAAEQIRALDPHIEIVMVTGFSDVEPQDITHRVPPPHKLLYVQKPFHGREIRQFAAALSAKWLLEKQLHQSNEELELRVREQTADLLQANSELRKEIAARAQTEQSLREAESKYRGLVDTSPDGIVLTDLEGRLLLCNLQAAHLHGYDRPEAMQGLSAFDLIAPEDHQRTWEEMRREPERSSAHNLEYTLLRRDGTRFPAELSASVVRSTAGEPTAYLVVERDITERKLAEERLLSSLREKEVLLKELHHRVRNNLQVVSSLLYLQSQRAETSASRGILQDSLNRVQSMALVHEKLYGSEDLARIDVGEYVRSLMDSLMESYGAGAQGVDTRAGVDEVMLSVDLAIPCGLLLNELLSNSLKHAFPGGQGGHIAVEFRTDGDGHYILQVEDDGVGLPHGLDVWKPETLGLQLVNMMVEQLCGTMQVDSREGTLFQISFPASGDITWRRRL